MATPSLYVIAGNDELRIKETAVAQVADLRKRLKLEGEWGLETVDGWVESDEGVATAVRRFVACLHSGSLFGGDARLIWLKNANFLADPRVAKLGDIEEPLEALVGTLEAGLPDGVTVLISLIGADKRRTLYKRLEKIAEVTLCDRASGRDAAEAGAQDIEAFFQKADRKIGPDVADRLVQLCTDDPRRLFSECEKLIIYAGNDPVITVEHVMEMVSPSREEQGWGLQEALLAGQTEKALATLRQLRFQSKAENEAIGLLTIVVNGARLALQCRLLLDKKWMSAGSFKATWTDEGAEILSKNKDGKLPAPFAVAKVAAQAGKRPIQHWTAFHRIVFDTYASLFDGTSDFWTKLEMMTLRLGMLGVRKAA